MITGFAANVKRISLINRFNIFRRQRLSFGVDLHAHRYSNSLITFEFAQSNDFWKINYLSAVKMSSATAKRENRLAQSKSPYLREHRHNPVDWYQWGEEAFQAARSANKPIFLSVGYSACHWCHVMRRESFDDASIAKVMNDNFINIKVDREERPDVDRVYMTYCQATTGSGGWPLSVWLTPELKPFLAGTYFPPDDRYHGHPGFKSVLKSVIDTWTKRPDDVRRISDRLVATLQEHMDPSRNKERIRQSATERSLTLHSSDTIDRVVTHYESSFDGEHGGFGHGGMKFPTPPNLNFLFHVYAERLNTNSEKALGARDMTLATLLHMYRGGIHDRLGGGFHRYSTDKFWHVPHFEKMMYDQGQLAVCYAEATQIINEMRMRGESVDTSEQWWRVALRGIMDYVMHDMSHPEGGFYSAEDAEAVPADDNTNAGTRKQHHEEKREGAFYVWTEKQIRDVLGAEKLPSSKRSDLSLADAVLHHFTCKEKGNVDPHSDPHDELKNQNVFLQRSSLADTADFFSLPVTDMRDALQKACKLLAAARAKRPRPALDDKMITGWNALMISGCAKAYQATGKTEYLERGVRAVRFLETYAYREETGTLLRCVYVDSNDPNRIHQHDAASPSSQPAVEASCDDYAFLIRALIDMYESSSDPSLLEWAVVLQRKQDEFFWDSGPPDVAESAHETNHAGGYFSSRRGQSDIILDIKDDQDNAEPSANSVSAQNLIRLHCYLNQHDMLQRADRIFDVFRTRILRGGHALTEMLVALMARTNPEKLQIVVCTDDANSAETDAMLKCIFKFYLPFKTLMVLDDRNRQLLEAMRPELSEMKTVGGKPTVYVCANFTCQEPCTDPTALDALLRKRIGRSEGDSDAEGGASVE